MPALALALGLSLLEAAFRFILATGAPCVAPRLLQRLSLVRESLLRLGAHCRLLKGLRCLADAPLGILRVLAHLGGPIAEEMEPLPPVYDELQNLIVGWLRTEDDARNAVYAVIDMLR